MRNLTDRRTYVVAGNGMSLTTIKTGQVLCEDFIVRTNNFFFERRFWLGDRVDLAVMGGDPRVSPFMFQTLKKSFSDYDVDAWTGCKAIHSKIGNSVLPGPSLNVPLYFDQACAEFCERLKDHYSLHFMTGTIAVLYALSLGARRIVLAGMDMYASGARYNFSPGKMHRALLGKDLGHRGVDSRIHNRKMDLELLAYLDSRPDISLTYAGKNPVLKDVLDEAPIRVGQTHAAQSRNPPQDWAYFSGAYPIALLWLLRKVRSWQNSLSRYGQ